jgi:hypothetical protein
VSVSEFTHDTADDGFHEIQLSGKQLVFLFIVTTTVIVVVFLCGVKVGRGARAAQGEADPAGVSATASPAPAEPSGSGARPEEPPAPAPEAPPDLGYDERLKDGSPPDVQLKPQTDTASAPESPAPAPRRTPAIEEKRTAPPAESAAVPSGGRAGTWAVQVIATLDRNMASSIVKRLVAKDYPAFLVNPPAGSGPAYYKVHIGRFTDRGEAEQVSQRIKKEEQFQSWITR